MGDRTTVTLSILASQHDKALKHFESEFYDSELLGVLVCCIFYEVNYGSLDFLHKLKADGIAYDSQWERGSEYGPGTKSLRFDSSGDAIEKDIHDFEKSLDVSALMVLIDQPKELRSLITSAHEQIATLPWDNQEEYGRRYQAKQLITPTS